MHKNQIYFYPKLIPYVSSVVEIDTWIKKHEELFRPLNPAIDYHSIPTVKQFYNSHFLTDLVYCREFAHVDHWQRFITHALAHSRRYVLLDATFVKSLPTVDDSSTCFYKYGGERRKMLILNIEDVLSFLKSFHLKQIEIYAYPIQQSGITYPYRITEILKGSILLEKQDVNSQFRTSLQIQIL